MIVTPFGDLDFKNQPMTLQWLTAHAVRHQTLSKELSRRGVALIPCPLFGKPTQEWIRVHFLTHMALLRVLPPDTTISVNTLSAYPTDSESLFYNWHQMHNLLHTKLDQALQVI